jgi:phosphoribosylformylglycinamidine cyclo-ligase
MPPPDEKALRSRAYAQAGVDLDRDDGFIERVKEIARSTHRPELLAGVGASPVCSRRPSATRTPCWSPRPTASARS